MVVTDGLNATIHSADDIELGAVNVRNDLAILADGDISNSDRIAVANNSTFTSGAGKSVVVDHSTNTFGGQVGFTSSGADPVECIDC